MKSLTAGDILQLHYELVEMFSDDPDSISPPGPRMGGMLESAAMRPLTSLGGTEKYPGLHAKAAALFHSLVSNHPFHNGNKRTAVMSLIALLSRNRMALTATDDELFDFVVAVASNRLAPEHGASSSADAIVDNIANWLRDHTRARGDGATDMQTTEFLDRLTKAGCRIRETGDGGSWLIQGQNDHSVRLSKSTRKIDGGAIKRYLGMLGLSQSVSGMYFEEFLEGRIAEQGSIQRYRNVLQRLAFT